MALPCYPVFQPAAPVFRTVRAAIRHHAAGAAQAHPVHHGIGTQAHLHHAAAHVPVAHAPVHSVAAVGHPAAIPASCAPVPGPLPAGPGFFGGAKATGASAQYAGGVAAVPGAGAGGAGAGGAGAGGAGLAAAPLGAGGLAGFAASSKAALVAGVLLAAAAGAGLTAAYDMSQSGNGADKAPAILYVTPAPTLLATAPVGDLGPVQPGETVPSPDLTPLDTTPGQPSTAVAVAVPEPASLLTFGLGSLATILLGRRARRRQATRPD